MATERALRQVQFCAFPPCEREFAIHYRDGEPIALVIDGKPYGVKPMRRGKGLRDGDKVLWLVEPPAAE